MKMLTVIVLLFNALFFSGILSAETVNIVTFNAENLFDTQDDVDNPRDDTYLPLAVKAGRGTVHEQKCAEHNSGFYLSQCKNLDWNEDVYDAKLKAYADVLLAMPSVPDVVVIPETENLKVMQDLVSRHLSGEGYAIVQLDTSDEPESRGIDVALLSKLPIVGEPTAHVVDFGRDRERCGVTRDILQATVELPGGENLTVFGVHFPSGRSPSQCRYRAFKQLSKLANDLPEGSLSVAAGDFNINCNETSSDAYARLLLRGNWYTSPVVTHGCTAPGSSKYVERLLYNWNTWSFLDQILVSQELSMTKPSQKNWFAEIGSFQTLVVHPSQYKVDEDDSGYIEPRRFDPVTKTGVSDHWPVGIRLLKRRNE